MAYADLVIYIASVATANRRDKPYYENTTGTVISGGASGVLSWHDNGNRKGWGRKDGSHYCYYKLEVINATTIRVYKADQLGDDTTDDVTVVAGGTYPSASNPTLVDGVSITLHSSLTAGHIAYVFPAIFALDGNTMYIERGAAADNVKMIVENPGTVTHKNAELRVGRSGWFDNTSGSALASINLTSDIAIADVYALTISNGTSSGKKFTFTGTLNTFIADNVANGATDQSVVGSPGWTFDAGAAPANTDTATLTISDGADAIQAAPDNAGVPDTWVTWNDVTALQIPLNRAGYTDQQIPAAQTITFWLRANPDITHPIGRMCFRYYTKSFQAEA